MHGRDVSLCTPNDEFSALRAAFLSPAGVHIATMPQACPAMLGGELNLVLQCQATPEETLDALGRLAAHGMYIFADPQPVRGALPVQFEQLISSVVQGNQVLAGTGAPERSDYEGAITMMEELRRSVPSELQALISRRYPLEETLLALTDNAPALKKIILF